MWKLTYQYICRKCNTLHYKVSPNCQSCGSQATLRLLKKEDYKEWKQAKKGK